MDREFYRNCIEEEVYHSFKRGKLSLIDRIWCIFFRPESNSVYLIRNYLYHVNRSGIHTILAKMDYVKLMRRYGIFISSGAEIDVGLHIIYPSNVIITSAKIGKNCTLFQNVTIGMKKKTSAYSDEVPKLGDNVTVYANASIIGKVTVADNSVIGANSLLLEDTIESGVYCGVPAQQKNI